MMKKGTLALSVTIFLMAVAYGGSCADSHEPTISVQEHQLPSGVSELRLIDLQGNVQDTYRLNLSKRNQPAATEANAVIRRWQSWKFGAFVCYNSNQFTGRELCALDDPKVYSPTSLDVPQWTETLEAAGMKYAVLTARHTSGFLLWDSPTSEMDVANSGDGTDVVGAFVEECHRRGIAPGIYYCMWGGAEKPQPNARAVILAQLFELATLYGPIPYFWIDMMNWAPEDLSPQEGYDLLKNLNPETVVILNQHIQRGTEIRYFPTDVLNGEMMMPPETTHQPLRNVGDTNYYLPFEYEPCSQKRAGEGSWKANSDYPGYVWFTYGTGRDFIPSEPLEPRFLYRYITDAYRRGTSNVLLACAPDHTGRFRDGDVKQLLELGNLLRSAGIVSAPTVEESVPKVTTVSIRAVEGGESAVGADECRGIVVGPGTNEVEPFPGWGGFVGWESPIRLRNGEWLVGFNAGYWHASPPTPLHFPEEVLKEWREMGMPDVDAPTGGRMMIVRSSDQGKTWSRPETFIDTPADDRHPSFLELPDGTILCSFFTYVGKGDFAADPSLAHRTHITRSFDGGKTWEQDPKPLPSPFVADETDGPMLLLDDGSVLVIINGGLAEGGPDQAAVLRTSDRGESWQLLSTISTDHDLLEPTIAQLPDGRLVMMARPEGDIAWSDDLGKTWSAPVTFGLRLYAPSLYVLQDGTLLCLHGSYAAGGLRATFSTDGGETWIGPATDRGFSIDNSYGYGKAMELPDGSLFIAYLSTGGHRTEDAQQNAVRCIRMRIRPDHSGIDLLPAPNREESE